MCLMKLKRGQAILEYTVLLAALVMAFTLMVPYLRRAAQSKLVVIQNQLNQEMD